jgi:hypothetical protein
VAFRILSWNIETFGEKKLAGIENFVARVIAHYNADAAFILEGTMYGEGEVAGGIARELEAITGQDWWPFGSSATGKSLFLPQTVNLPNYCDLGQYLPVMLLCYTELTARRFQLKPTGQINPTDIPKTREVLEANGVLRRDLETYMGVFRFDPAMYPQYRVNVALGSWVAVSPVRPGALVSADAAGNEIGYGDPNSAFNGRRPFLANFYFAKPTSPNEAEQVFPVVCFHAPFSPDLKVRMRANVGLLNLATAGPGLAPIPLWQQQAAVVCGDFNVDFDWTEDFTGLPLPVPATESLNAQNYGSFFAAGLRMTIQELTSLKKPGTALEPVTNPMAFRANAYDNVIVKATAGGPVSAAAGTVIDLISDVYWANQGFGNYLKGTPGMPKTPTWFDAFKYVRTKVSDHLPVLCTLTVPERP